MGWNVSSPAPVILGLVKSRPSHSGSHLRVIVVLQAHTHHHNKNAKDTTPFTSLHGRRYTPDVHRGRQLGTDQAVQGGSGAAVGVAGVHCARQIIGTKTSRLKIDCGMGQTHDNASLEEAEVRWRIGLCGRLLHFVRNTLQSENTQTRHVNTGRDCEAFGTDGHIWSSCVLLVVVTRGRSPWSPHLRSTAALFHPIPFLHPLRFLPPSWTACPLRTVPRGHPCTAAENQGVHHRAQTGMSNLMYAKRSLDPLRSTPAHLFAILGGIAAPLSRTKWRIRTGGAPIDTWDHMTVGAWQPPPSSHHEVYFEPRLPWGIAIRPLSSRQTGLAALDTHSPVAHRPTRPQTHWGTPLPNC